MPRRGSLVPALQASALAAFAAYAGVTLLTSPGDPANEAASRWLYPVLFLLAVALIVARVVLVRADRLAWGLIAASLVAWAFAEVYDAALGPLESPSPADAGWIAFYPLVYVGMVLLLRRRARPLAGALWLDGLTASVAAAALGAAVLLEVVLPATEGSPAEVATNLAYPLGDVLLLSAVFGIFSLWGWRLERPWVALGIGVLATTVADAVYLFELGSYQSGSAIDVLWPASVLVIAAAGWVSASGRRPRLDGRPLLAVPVGCALLGIGILVVDHFNRLNAMAVTLAAATLLLVLVRLVATFRENSRLYSLTRQEAITDALTGLGNRRKLVADLEALLGSDEPASTVLAIFDLNGFKAYNDRFGHPAGDALLARLGAKLAAVAGPDGAYRLGGDEFCLVQPTRADEVEHLIARASAALSERGEGFDVSSAHGAALLPDESADVSDALALADERLYAQKHRRRLEGDPTVHAFLEALAVREPDLLAHLDGVGGLSLEVGRRLGLGADALDQLFRAARLHDLGKLAVPEEILAKRGPLDEREWEFIQQHTVVGERILRASPAFRSIAPVVRSSHENWDGTGYPDGLVGEEIPVAARIIRACDAFSAMISARPYRPALDVEVALDQLERGAGSHFDPAVVRVLVEHVREERVTEHAA